jgi:hypothetical protein
VTRELEDGAARPAVDLSKADLAAELTAAQLITADIEILKIADQHLLHDLKQFWQRGNFFVLVQGGILSVFTGVAKDTGHRSTLSIALAAFGFTLALFWGQIAFSTADRVTVWREEVMRLDAAIDRHGVFAQTEQRSSIWRNPTKIAVVLPVIVAIGWIALSVAYYAP